MTYTRATQIPENAAERTPHQHLQMAVVLCNDLRRREDFPTVLHGLAVSTTFDELAKHGLSPRLRAGAALLAVKMAVEADRCAQLENSPLGLVARRHAVRFSLGADFTPRQQSCIEGALGETLMPERAVQPRAVIVSQSSPR